MGAFDSTRSVSAAAVKYVWRRLPPPVLSTPPLRAVGKMIHKFVSRRNKLFDGAYCPCNFTRFMRNVPLLEVLGELAAQQPVASDFRVTSVACSSGAELYSVLWRVRSARPDLRVTGCGFDVSPPVVAKAEAGVFLPSDEELSWMSEAEVASFFDREDGVLKVKASLRQDINWMVADALDPALARMVAPQDIVLANNFLGPLPEKVAEQCLCNLARMVKAGGYLVLFGLDFDFKTRWVNSHRYLPVTAHIEEVHYADRSLQGWPWERWGVEPLEKTRADWRTRYAAVFQSPAAGPERLTEACASGLAMPRCCAGDRAMI